MCSDVEKSVPRSPLHRPEFVDYESDGETRDALVPHFFQRRNGAIWTRFHPNVGRNEGTYRDIYIRGKSRSVPVERYSLERKK